MRDGKALQRKAQITLEDREASRLWALERAQTSFEKGRDYLARGDLPQALLWYERAYRLAPTSFNVMYALAELQIDLKDYAGAWKILRPMMQEHDFREGWLYCALVHAALGHKNDMRDALQRTLSFFAPSAPVASLAQKIVKLLGEGGWCGLSGEGFLSVGLFRAEEEGQLRVYVDGRAVELAKSNQDGLYILPEGWESAALLSVVLGDKPLIGSPIHIQAIRRLEGFVEVKGGKLSGWVWHPAEPEREPVISILPGSGGRRPLLRNLKLKEYAVDVDSDIPLHRPRVLAIPAEKKIEGFIRVTGPDGHDITGSPLYTDIESRMGEAVAQAQASYTRQPGQVGHDIAVSLPNFIPVPAAFRGRDPSVSGVRAAVSVVVPVYRDYERTRSCLESVLNTVGPGVQVVVVDDHSPDTALVQYVEKLHVEGRISLVRHERNRGFPAAANSGMRACAGRDVILLNSDTLVAKGWVEALVEAAYSADDVGTATPLSNDASILSYPHRDEPNPAPSPAMVRRLMDCARNANQGEYVDIPTGNGFCMYMRHDCLEQTGLFREDIFAQGYGEENDFCLRARHLGWRHLGVPGVFVGHVGGVSFGGARRHLMRRNLDILNRLYPGYNDLIQDYLLKDPLIRFRRKLDMLRWRLRYYRKNTDMDTVLLITHDQGGGVERVIREQAVALQKSGFHVLILKPAPGGCILKEADSGAGRSSIEGLFPNLYFRLPQDYAVLKRFLEIANTLSAWVHHYIGHHPIIRRLVQDMGLPYDIYIHDYMWFCQRVCLMGRGGRYCGEPDIAGCEACIDMLGSYLSEDQISVPDFLARSQRELYAAHSVVTMSHDASHRIVSHFPLLRPKIQFHEDDRQGVALLQRYRKQHKKNAGEPVRVCVIGSISPEKGYNVLCDLARDARRQGLPLEFVVVGHTSDDMKLMGLGPVFVTGEYKEEDAVALIRKQQADIALMPSVIPETWCFTLSLAWKAGLPVVVFDIGTPAERIRRVGGGHIVPLDISAPELNRLLLSWGEETI